MIGLLQDRKTIPIPSNNSIPKIAASLAQRSIGLCIFQILHGLVLQILEQIARLQRSTLDRTGQRQHNS
jgi:hypothetical protein